MVKNKYFLPYPLKKCDVCYFLLVLSGTGHWKYEVCFCSPWGKTSASGRTPVWAERVKLRRPGWVETEALEMGVGSLDGALLWMGSRQSERKPARGPHIL